MLAPSEGSHKNPTKLSYRPHPMCYSAGGAALEMLFDRFADRRNHKCESKLSRSALPPAAAAPPRIFSAPLLPPPTNLTTD
jgi:hypothetical protein